MKTKLTCIALFALLGTGGAFASPITLEPTSGAVTGTPGSIVGWGFTVQAHPTLWTSFVTSFTLSESDPSIGFYTDFIGMQGGPVNFVLAPGAPDWVQAFDNSGQTGIGAFAILASAPAGAQNSGLIHVLFDLFTGDPNVCGGCYSGSGELDLPFAVTVVNSSPASAPEPATWTLMGAALGGLALFGLRRSDIAVYFPHAMPSRAAHRRPR
jgi:hypothetical protein